MEQNRKDRTWILFPAILLPFILLALIFSMTDLIWAGLMPAFGGLLLARGIRSIRHPDHCEAGNEKFWSSAVISPWMSVILGICLIALGVYMLIYLLFIH